MRVGLRVVVVAAVLGGSIHACEVPEADPELAPDATLRRELGLGVGDRVHTVTLTGGEQEEAVPAELEIIAGAWLQFVSGDWRVHEVSFEADSLSADALAFLERTDQMHSPPLLRKDARFVLTFEGAPPGRYPYVLRGNTRDGRGAVIVPTAAER